MGFSRQEYWSGLPFPSPGDLPDPGIKPRSLTLQADTLTSEPAGPLKSLKIPIVEDTGHREFCIWILLLQNPQQALVEPAREAIIISSQCSLNKTFPKINPGTFLKNKQKRMLLN